MKPRNIEVFRAIRRDVRCGTAESLLFSGQGDALCGVNLQSIAGEANNLTEVHRVSVSSCYDNALNRLISVVTTNRSFFGYMIILLFTYPYKLIKRGQSNLEKNLFINITALVLISQHS